MSRYWGRASQAYSNQNRCEYIALGLDMPDWAGLLPGLISLVPYLWQSRVPLRCAFVVLALSAPLISVLAVSIVHYFVLCVSL